MPSRFVILHHRHADGEHWDLMVEQGDVLLTWRLGREPVGRSSLPIPAKRIADHRKAYLDYEGPVSGDRGYVRRVDAGTVEFQESTSDCFILSMAGTRLSGRFTLLVSGDDWVLTEAPDR